MGWIGVITNAGAEIIARLAGGDHELTIMKATIGSGIVAEANLRTQTGVSGEVGEISIVKKTDVTGGVKIRLRVSPTTGAGYVAHQIGVWGKLDNGAETLIMLHQDSETGIAIPTAAESPEFVFDYIAVLAVSNTENLTVTIESGVYATIDDLDGKADKVSEATGGNLAGLDSTGNLTDSGYKASDFAASADLSGKADKVSGATSGNIAGLDSNGNLQDSGKKASDFAVPSSVVDVTAAAGSWSSATPPTQTISVTGVTAINNIIVSPASNITAEQYDALAAGKILCTAQAAGTITLTCYGIEPSVNIPISVMIMG